MLKENAAISMDAPETGAMRPASPLLKADNATLVFVETESCGSTIKGGPR
jgi:hypothetical protein